MSAVRSHTHETGSVQPVVSANPLIVPRAAVRMVNRRNCALLTRGSRMRAIWS
jgi:hypothetical protein